MRHDVYLAATYDARDCYNHGRQDALEDKHPIPREEFAKETYFRVYEAGFRDGRLAKRLMA